MRKARIPSLVLLLLVVGLVMAPSALAKRHNRHHGHGNNGGLSITKSPFGSVDGQDVDKYTLTNKNGMTVDVITYGGIIQSLSVPDRRGHFDNVTLGFADLAGYL